MWSIFFFSNFASQKILHRKFLSERKYGDMGLLSEKMEALHAELNERAEAASSSYSGALDFLQYIYSVLLAKNH